MAEGMLNHFYGDRYCALSAGANPAGYVHPMAIRAMTEIGIDISRQLSKHIQAFLPPDGDPPDVIVSVCSTADENCPVFPGNVERWQWPFDDPAHATGSDEDKFAEFQRVRDEIKRALDARFGS